MKIFLIAGEASGDLHASHLMRAILDEYPDTEFRYYGGDKMQAVGGNAPMSLSRVSLHGICTSGTPLAHHFARYETL